MADKLRVLSLFSGTGSFSVGFSEAGHDVWHVDLFEEPDPEAGGRFIRADVRHIAKDPEAFLDSIEPGWRPDVILGGPMCMAFTMAGSGSKANGSKRWRYDGPFKFFGPRLPTDTTARQGCALVVAMLHIIDVLRPRYWWMENPMGGLMTMGFVPKERVIITYCAYGDTRMKPTVLWGQWPASWKPRPRCKNRAPCHVAAPRGAKTGTQGLKGSRERGRMPPALSREIAAAVVA